MNPSPGPDQPSPPIGARSIGRGALEFLASTTTATVVGPFGNGFYLTGNGGGPADSGTDGRVMAVVDATISDGPLYLTHGARITPPPAGSLVHVVDGRSIVGPGWRLDTTPAKTFEPTVPATAAGRPLLRRIEAAVPADLQERWPGVEACARLGDRRHLRNLLAGRGRGLTPEGDDVLAGAFLVWAMDRGARTQLAELAATAPTTGLSRAFLRWAAVGECVAELHGLLWAANDGRWRDVALCQQRVRAIGGTTGSAMLAGIKLAASHESCSA